MTNLRHFTYLPQYNLLYCRIPKTDIGKRIALCIMKNNPISFANVRHPFERLVSGYLDSVVHWSTKNTYKYKGQSFTDFITNTVLREADKMELQN